jgi:hypothetical protein
MSHPKPPRADHAPYRWIEPRPSEAPNLSRQIAIIDTAFRFMDARYREFVASGEMTPDTAAVWLSDMLDAKRTLQWVKDNESAIKRRAG